MCAMTNRPQACRIVSAPPPRTLLNGRFETDGKTARSPPSPPPRATRAARPAGRGAAGARGQRRRRAPDEGGAPATRGRAPRAAAGADDRARGAPRKPLAYRRRAQLVDGHVDRQQCAREPDSPPRPRGAPARGSEPRRSAGISAATARRYRSPGSSSYQRGRKQRATSTRHSMKVPTVGGTSTSKRGAPGPRHGGATSSTRRARSARAPCASSGLARGRKLLLGWPATQNAGLTRRSSGGSSVVQHGRVEGDVAGPGGRGMRAQPSACVTCGAAATARSAIQ